MIIILFGYQAGATSAWKHDKILVPKENASDYSYNCGYTPRFVFVHASRNSGSVSTILFSMDSCASVRQLSPGWTEFGDSSAYLQATSNGLRFVGWSAYDWVVEIWTIK